MHEQLTIWHCFLGSVLFPGNVLGVVVSSSICMCRVGVVKHKMDHLACFIPAMLALGAHAGAVKEEKAKRYMQARSHFDVTTFLLLCADRMLHAHLRRALMLLKQGKGNGVMWQQTSYWHLSWAQSSVLQKLAYLAERVTGCTGGGGADPHMLADVPSDAYRYAHHPSNCCTLLLHAKCASCSIWQGRSHECLLRQYRAA